MSDTNDPYEFFNAWPVQAYYLLDNERDVTYRMATLKQIESLFKQLGLLSVKVVPNKINGYNTLEFKYDFSDLGLDQDGRPLKCTTKWPT